MNGQDYEQLRLFQEDSHVSHFLLPGSAEAAKTTVSSGRKCCELYRKSGPLGQLVRMLLVSSAWRSTRCYLTWKVSATPRKRLLFRLAASMPRTSGRDVQLLGTPTAKMWPTPTARDYKGANSLEHLTRPNGGHLWQLANAVRMFPTPKAQNALGAGQKHGDGGPSLDVVVGGQLNPTWVEWLMGFPIGWTDLNA